MNDLLTLQALCTLLMCDDSTHLTPDARERIEKWADKESREMGFDNWIDAYHGTPDVCNYADQCLKPEEKPVVGVVEMGLCEVPHITLRPDQLYRFVVMPDCEKCKDAAAPYQMHADVLAQPGENSNTPENHV